MTAVFRVSPRRWQSWAVFPASGPVTSSSFTSCQAIPERTVRPAFRTRYVDRGRRGYFPRSATGPAALLATRRVPPAQPAWHPACDSRMPLRNLPGTPLATRRIPPARPAWDPLATVRAHSAPVVRPTMAHDLCQRRRRPASATVAAWATSAWRTTGGGPAGPRGGDPDGPVVMGVLNVTPDSFSDGGRYADLDAAVAHGVRMHAEGRRTWSTSAASPPGRAPSGSTRRPRRPGCCR